MPTRRLSLHLPQVALDALSPGPDDTLAGRITEVALRHRALLTEATPSLTEAQWCACADALNGYWLLCESAEPTADPVRHVWAEIADTDGLGDKWNIDAQALSELLVDMPYAAQAAVCDVVRRFWQHPDLNKLDAADLLRACGARIAP